MLRRVIFVVAAVAALAVMATPALAAKGGNSASAKACQKGGWESLARTESPSTGFTSEEECTSYAAKGGVLTQESSGTLAAEQACITSSTLDGQPSVFMADEGGWSCEGMLSQDERVRLSGVLQPLCEAPNSFIVRREGAAFPTIISCTFLS